MTFQVRQLRAKVRFRVRQCAQEQFAERRVEPNSTLGEAIQYMTKHWSALTLFLRVAGAPLDNNLCERVLKKAIRVLPAGMRDRQRWRSVALWPRPFRATGATHEQNRGRSAGGFGPAATTAG